MGIGSFKKDELIEFKEITPFLSWNERRKKWNRDQPKRKHYKTAQAMSSIYNKAVKNGSREEFQGTKAEIEKWAKEVREIEGFKKGKQSAKGGAVK